MIHFSLSSLAWCMIEMILWMLISRIVVVEDVAMNKFEANE